MILDLRDFVTYWHGLATSGKPTRKIIERDVGDGT
jgi:hypothetical protein